MEDPQEALAIQQRDVPMSERAMLTQQQKVLIWISIDSPSNITNLKNEIEKRQQERSSENDEEVKQGAIELPKAIAKAPAAAQILINFYFLP